MGMILVLYCAFLCAFAWYEARGDFRLIAANKEVDHTVGWIRRTITCLFAALLTNLTNDGDILLKGLMLLFLAYGLWTPVFRACLNWMRDKPYFYISMSSKYDRFFLSQFKFLPEPAGRASYIVEIACAVVATVLYIYLNS